MSSGEGCFWGRIAPQKAFMVALLTYSMLLAGCSEKLWLIKPFDVSKSSQVVMANFLIKKEGDYQFSLLFVWKDSLREMEEQEEIFGSGGVPIEMGESNFEGNKGVPIPLDLRLVKDGTLLLEERVDTSGVAYYQSFEYEGSSKSAAGRLIKNISLEPGNYFVEVRTVIDIKEFAGGESYIKFAYYKPKI
ncbi:DUF5625 family protein [Pseudomonas sp. BN102]|uniref:DUF5625 family protein n=1 Tax=Pseudomonas sp. BN102 TaxID=2567886 RepID=UPI002457BBA4|nr:DUF5625 family protein [Pseudomonas sp. BN102]MDH4609348.1 hypothetical protein [Pseudomonas sp. BN102]